MIQELLGVIGVARGGGEGGATAPSPPAQCREKNCQQNAKNVTIEVFSAHETYQLQTYLSRKNCSKSHLRQSRI